MAVHKDRLRQAGAGLNPIKLTHMHAGPGAAAKCHLSRLGEGEAASCEATLVGQQGTSSTKTGVVGLSSVKLARMHP